MKRYEREISELLDKMDDFIPDERPRRRRRRQWHFVHRARLVAQSIWPRNLTVISVTPNSLIIASIVMAFVAYFLHDVFRPVAPLASIAAVLLLLAAIAMNVLKRHRPVQRRWRGQVVDLDDYRPIPSSTFGYWWRKIRKSTRRGPWNNF